MEVPERFNAAEHFLDRHIAEGRGGKIAIRCAGRELTYAEVLEQVRRAAAGLAELGVERGDRVLMVLPDGVEFVAAWFAAMRLGAVAVPCNTALRGADYARFIEESRPKALIADAAVHATIEPALGTGVQVIVSGEPRPGRASWDAWIEAQAPTTAAPAPTSKDDVAFWLWTSGSTGAPKAAVHRHADWVYVCEFYARDVLGMRADDVTFSGAKLFHAYGLGNGLMFPFYVGASTVLYGGKPRARALLQTAHDTRPTLLFAVPTMFAAMLDETDAANPYRLDSVRAAVSAAEPLAPEIFHRVRERFGFEILDGIGSTEVLHIYISGRPGEIKPGSTGRPVPGYDVRITDEQGREVAPGEIGDLWVRGESLARCYWNRPEITAERMRDGWFFTGDKYHRDAEGYYWYAGRSDDLFRVLGEWVSPFEVESALAAHPAVLEAAVVPYTDEHRLLKPKACVVVKGGWTAGEELARDLQKAVHDRLAGYKCPRQVEFWDELPKTATGKIQRYKLRATSAAGSYR